MSAPDRKGLLPVPVIPSALPLFWETAWDGFAGPAAEAETELLMDSTVCGEAAGEACPGLPLPMLSDPLCAMPLWSPVFGIPFLPVPGVPKEPASTDCPYAYPDASGGIVGSGGAGCLVFPASAGAVPDDAKVPGAVNEAAGVTVELYESYDSYGSDEADDESDDEAAGLFVPRLSSCWSLSYPCCALPVFS